MPLNLDDPEVKKELDEYIAKIIPDAVNAATASLKQKNEQLIAEKRTVQEKLKDVEGLDIPKLKELQQRLETDEEVQLISQGKLDDVFNRRFQRVQNEFTSKITDLEKEVLKSRENEQSAKSLARKTVVEINLRRAAEQAGVLPQAIDDVIRRGGDTFHVDEDGSIIQRDHTGNIVTIDGKNAEPRIWLEKLKETSPHYWPTSTGAGLGGGNADGRTVSEENLSKLVAAGDMVAYRAARNPNKKN